MGANEDELARIAAAGPFTVPALESLKASMATLAETMKNVAGSPGWESISADAASSRLEQLSRDYFTIELLVGQLQSQVDEANRVRSLALADYEGLAPAKAPSWVHDTLDAFDFPGIPQPVDLAQGGLSIIEGFLGGQRDAAAGRILGAYRDALVPPGDKVIEIAQTIADYGSSTFGEPIPGPDPTPPDDGQWGPGPGYAPPGGYNAPGYTPPSYSGGYVSPGPWVPPGYPGAPEYPDPQDPEIGVDDPNIGTLPGGPTTIPGGPGGGTPGYPGGSGLPVGAGVGAGAAIAGAATAARLGGTAGAAGVGAAARLGTGGLLGGAGMGAPGMNGAAGANAARAGGGAGGRGAGGGMMGAGANAGGSREERKRGRGLGGPIAPKLDDEDPTMLPGAGARAGGRAEASTPSDDD